MVMAQKVSFAPSSFDRWQNEGMHQDIMPLQPSLEPHPFLMTRDEFVSQYQPVMNAMNPAAPSGGWMHATEGPEFDVLCTENMAHVWSMRSTDAGLLIVSNGLMLNEPIGYYLTRTAHDPRMAIEVIMSPFHLFEQLERCHGLGTLSTRHKLSRGMQLELASWHQMGPDDRMRRFS
jgi:hypothetical protein